MIIPMLQVADLPRAVAFYRDIIGLSLVFSVAADQRMGDAEALVDGAVFAVLDRGGGPGQGQLMLQTHPLNPDAPALPGPGAVYLRDLDPAPILSRAPEGAVLTGIARAWYGMAEAHLIDPDGHVLCIGMPEGPPPG